MPQLRASLDALARHLEDCFWSANPWTPIIDEAETIHHGLSRWLLRWEQARLRK